VVLRSHATPPWTQLAMTEMNRIVSYLQADPSAAQIAAPGADSGALSSNVARSDVELAGDGVGRLPGREPTLDGRNRAPAAPAHPCVLALDFGGTKIAVAVCAPDPLSENTGMIETTEVVQTVPELGADANLERAVALADRLRAGAPVAAVGACTFGIPREDGVALSPAIEGWDRLPLRGRLEEAFQAPVVVDTDVKAAATAELRHGALVGADPALYLNLGTGLAVALVAGGRVIRGANGAAGEIGSSLLRTCGSSHGAGILEDVVSGMGLARSMATQVHGERRRTGADAELVAALFESSGGEDAEPSLQAILDEFLDELCFHMVNLTVALDPERIAVGGGLVRSWDRIEGPLRRALEDHVPYPPQLVTGAYPFDAALRGAIDLGRELAGTSGAGAGSGAPGSPAPVLSAPHGSSGSSGNELEDLVKTTKGGRQC
jgi:glucokinase